MWRRWRPTTIARTALTTTPACVHLLSISCLIVNLIVHTTSQNIQITPKSCQANGLEGTCMFVWDCIKSEGQHIGICVDSFMFGSCCSHNLTDNFVLPQTTTYPRPTKPIHNSNSQHSSLHNFHTSSSSLNTHSYNKYKPSGNRPSIR
jgi:hypothetical protein